MRLATLLLVSALTALPQRPPAPRSQQGCPPAGTSQPPRERAEDDYVELVRTPCFGSCPDYTVRVLRSGLVTWSAKSYVAIDDAEAHIDPAIANALIERFRTPEFWALCEAYTAQITDLPHQELFVRFGKTSKRVSDYAASAPDFVRELQLAIDRTANTHRWIHGDAQTEPFFHVRGEMESKPGLTPLMLAVIQYKLDEVKSLLRAGAQVNATDASGWTALMYASHQQGSQIVPLLIGAGANVNQRSPRGDTALMASAFSGAFSQDLLDAKANFNAQNADGVTALMLVANNAFSQGLAEVLKAGADAKLKDAKGRTALDYLEAAHCGHPLLATMARHGDIGDATGCKGDLGDERYPESKALLQTAMRAGAR